MTHQYEPGDIVEITIGDTVKEVVTVVYYSVADQAIGFKYSPRRARELQRGGIYWVDENLTKRVG